jgi:predicted fused transcriptional regulator/phosphomethylpyrimidine kinase
VVLGNLVTAVQMLENRSEFISLIHEVRVNLAYALPEAQTSQDIATVEGQLQPQLIALFILKCTLGHKPYE